MDCFINLTLIRQEADKFFLLIMQFLTAPLFNQFGNCKLIGFKQCEFFVVCISVLDVLRFPKLSEYLIKTVDAYICAQAAPASI